MSQPKGVFNTGDTEFVQHAAWQCTCIQLQGGIGIARLVSRAICKSVLVRPREAAYS